MSAQEKEQKQQQKEWDSKKEEIRTKITSLQTTIIEFNSVADDDQYRESTTFHSSLCDTALLLQSTTFLLSSTSDDKFFIQIPCNHRFVTQQEVDDQVEAIKASTNELTGTVLVCPHIVSESQIEGVTTLELQPVVRKEYEFSSKRYGYILSLEAAKEFYQLVHPKGKDATLPPQVDPYQIIAKGLQIMFKMSPEEKYATMLENVVGAEEARKKFNDIKSKNELSLKFLFRESQKILQQKCSVRLGLVDGLLRSTSVLQMCLDGSPPNTVQLGTAIKLITPIKATRNQGESDMEEPAPLSYDFGIHCKQKSAQQQSIISSARPVRLFDGIILAAQFLKTSRIKDKTPPWKIGEQFDKDFMITLRQGLTAQLRQNVWKNCQLKDKHHGKTWHSTHLVAAKDDTFHKRWNEYQASQKSESNKTACTKNMRNQSLEKHCYTQLVELVSLCMFDDTSQESTSQALLAKVLEGHFSILSNPPGNFETLQWLEIYVTISHYFTRPVLKLCDAMINHDNLEKAHQYQTNRFCPWLPFLVKHNIVNEILKVYSQHGLSHEDCDFGNLFCKLAGLIETKVVSVLIDVVEPSYAQTSSDHKRMYQAGATLDKFMPKFWFEKDDDDKFYLFDVATNTDLRARIDEVENQQTRLEEVQQAKKRSAVAATAPRKKKKTRSNTDNNNSEDEEEKEQTPQLLSDLRDKEKNIAALRLENKNLKAEVKSLESKISKQAELLVQASKAKELELKAVQDKLDVQKSTIEKLNQQQKTSATTMKEERSKLMSQNEEEKKKLQSDLEEKEKINAALEKKNQELTTRAEAKEQEIEKLRKQITTSCKSSSSSNTGGVVSHPVGRNSPVSCQRINSNCSFLFKDPIMFEGTKSEMVRPSPEEMDILQDYNYTALNRLSLKQIERFIDDIGEQQPEERAASTPTRTTRSFNKNKRQEVESWIKQKITNAKV